MLIAPINIKLPLIYGDLYNEVDLFKKICVIHPPVDIKRDSVICALLLSHFLKGEEVLIVGNQSYTILNKTKDLFRKLKVGKFRTNTRSTLTYGDGVLSTDVNYLKKPKRAYVIDGHNLNYLDKSILNAPYIVIFTNYPDKISWVYQLTIASTNKEYYIKYIYLKDIYALWKSSENTGLLKADPYYERRMLFRDIDPTFKVTPFLFFARTRLFVKTDKPLEWLNEQQVKVVKQQVGTPIVPFYLTKLQKKYLAFKRKTIAKGKKPWFILLKYRRGGFTTLEQGLHYEFATNYPNSEVLTLAHNLESTKRIFANIVKVMHERDPFHIEDIANSKIDLRLANGSHFAVSTAGNKSTSRGDTLQRAHLSEVAYWNPGPNQEALINDQLAGILGATTHGEVVLETTANGRNKFYSIWKDAKEGLNEFTPIFIRWFDDPNNRLKEGAFSREEIKDTIQEEEKILIDRWGLDLNQIAFRRDRVRTYKTLFRQEMPEDDEACFISSGFCFFNSETIFKRLLSLTGTEGSIKTYPGGTEIKWEEYCESDIYVAGADASEGIPGLDPNGICVWNKTKMRPAISLHGYFSPNILKDHILRLRKEYNIRLLGIEREKFGYAVINLLNNMGSPHNIPHYRGGYIYWHRQDRPGWSTNIDTRPTLLDDLATFLELYPERIYDKEFLNECASFRLQSNSKFAADSGCHDDRVMKYGIAIQMAQHRIKTPEIS